MNCLIKNTRVLDPHSPHHQKQVDILIEQGVITQIGSQLKTEKINQVIEAENQCVSPGWFDMQANFCDPGYEQREDLQSGMRAAMQGGFTGVCIMPATDPPVQNKSQIEYLLQATRKNLVDVFPSACLTQHADGKEMTEMYDLKKAGAVAFTDYKKPIKEAGLLVRLLQYAQNTGTLIMSHCEDTSLTTGGHMNEGEMATRLGLKGMPALSEELMIQRNIQVLSYAGGNLHIPTVSTRMGCEYIKQAKNKNLSLSAGIAAHQLLLQDSALSEFDTNLKVNPPLRDKAEVESLRKALINDAIDVIVSDHCPEEIENKDVEFDHAAYGMIALETAYAAANTALYGKMEQEKLIEKISLNPRKILGLPVPVIKVGEKANLTLFNPDLKWNFESRHIFSKSKNTPFLNYTFTGKPLAVINNDKLTFCK